MTPNPKYRHEIRETQAEIDQLQQWLPDEREKVRNANSEAHKADILAGVKRDHAAKLAERVRSMETKLRLAKERLERLSDPDY